MIYRQTTTKQISLFNVYERSKYPPPVYNLNFTSYPILMILILFLKFKVKSKLKNNFDLMQKIKLKSCSLL